MEEAARAEDPARDGGGNNEDEEEPKVGSEREAPMGWAPRT